MPNTMKVIDAGLPPSSPNDSLEDRIAALERYIIMLTEELGYLFRNLDMKTNMNEKSVKQFMDQTMNSEESAETQDMTLSKLVVNAAKVKDNLEAGALYTPALRSDNLYVTLTPVQGLMLNNTIYGDALPSYPTPGRIFFKKAT